MIALRQNLTADLRRWLADKLELTKQVYTDPRLLDVHGALDALPTLTPDVGSPIAESIAVVEVIGLDQQDFVTAIIVEQADRPIVEPAIFQDRYECIVACHPLPDKFLVESVDLIPWVDTCRTCTTPS